MIRLVSILAALVALGLLVLVVAPAVVRRHRRVERRQARLERIEDYQGNAALEDLDRTRRRVNEQQDRHFTQRDDST